MACFIKRLKLLHFPRKKIVKTAAAAAIALTLAACGGEGGSSASVGGHDAPAPIAQSTLSGIAAIGAPVAGGQVDCKCASGASGSTSTAADGSFSLELLGSDYPCALSLTGGTADGKPLATPLHSVAHTAGTANITPLTDLMVAHLSGENPAQWYARATQGDLASTITESRLAQALDALKSALAILPGKPAVPADFDPVSSHFKAERGDAADDLLENYGRALEAADLTQENATAYMAAGEKMMATTYSATAFTLPGWTSFALAIAQNSDGTEMLVLPDPTLGTQKVAIESRDAEGNITALASDGRFTSILSFLGNRIGMISGYGKHFNKATSTAAPHYVYLSDEFEPVDFPELVGKTFRDYTNGEDNGLFSLDAQGMLWDHDDTSAEHVNIRPAFSPAGLRSADETSAVIIRNKAYKYTSGGKTTYAIVGTVASDPEDANPDLADQYVHLAISE